MVNYLCCALVSHGPCASDKQIIEEHKVAVDLSLQLGSDLVQLVAKLHEAQENCKTVDQLIVHEVELLSSLEKAVVSYFEERKEAVLREIHTRYQNRAGKLALDLKKLEAQIKELSNGVNRAQKAIQEQSVSSLLPIISETVNLSSVVLLRPSTLGRLGFSGTVTGYASGEFIVVYSTSNVCNASASDQQVLMND